MKEFKVGDKVVSFMGYGVVTALKNDASTFPVEITFYDGRTCSFMSDGRCYNSDEFPALFHMDNMPDKWREILQKEKRLSQPVQ